MVKKSKSKKPASIEEYIDGAATKTVSPTDQPVPTADPHAPHKGKDSKSISLKMNQYTYDLLTEAAEIEERSIVGTMRIAIQKYAKGVIKENS